MQTYKPKLCIQSPGSKPWKEALKTLAQIMKILKTLEENAAEAETIRLSVERVQGHQTLMITLNPADTKPYP